MGNVFCFGNTEIFCFDMLKMFSFSEKNKRRDWLLSFWFLWRLAYLSKWNFFIKTKPYFPDKTVLWKGLLIPTCFCWMLLKMYHGSSFQPISESISVHLPECVYVCCTCIYMYARDQLLPSATYVNPSGGFHQRCACMNESRIWLRICNQYIRLTEWFEMLGESCYINVSHYYL